MNYKTIKIKKVPAWYNTSQEILEKFTTLEGINQIISARHNAREAKQKLIEFYVFGNYHLDTCGNFSKASVDIKKNFPDIPDILTSAQYWRFIKKNKEKIAMSVLSFGLDHTVPRADLVCPECKQGWDIHNWKHAIVHKSEDNKCGISLSDFIGHTLAEVKQHFIKRHDAVYTMCQPEMVIRNDRYIDRTPDPNFQEHNQKYPKNIFVKNLNGWIGIKKGRSFGITDDYIVQPGDDGYFMIWTYYHDMCYHDKNKKTH